LQAVGLHRQLVAADRAEYVKMGIRLASDHMMLNNLRQGLRERVQQSPLMDANAFTRALEKRYRQIWAEWCSQEN
jgi:predicted O-linked N-acetylglucosamine transferase (SPINDLY family)